MGDLVSGLIWLVIILVFVTPWVRSIVERNQRPVTGRPTRGGPRDIAESGGYQPAPPVREGQVGRVSFAERSVDEEAPTTIRRTAAAPIAAVSPRVINARTVRRALATPESLRTAILLKEIMDPPVSMKESGR